MKWENDLVAFTAFYNFEPKDRSTLDQIEANMKHFYPGAYHLEWNRDKTVCKREVIIVFDDADDGLCWMLRNS